MTEGGIVNVTASVSVHEDVQFQKDTGVTVRFDGTDYPARVIECGEVLTKGCNGQAVIGLMYFTVMPTIGAGAEFALMDGARHVGSGIALEALPS